MEIGIEGWRLSKVGGFLDVYEQEDKTNEVKTQALPGKWLVSVTSKWWIMESHLG